MTKTEIPLEVADLTVAKIIELLIGIRNG